MVDGKPAREHPKWVSWKAHVRLLCFVLRRSYNAETDGDRLDTLISDYDTKFDAAYGPPFRKPKHHVIKHLRKYLRLYGPFVLFWCMGFEGSLNTLKRMFEGCNWKSPAASVAKRWLLRRSFRQSRGLLLEEYSFETESELLVGDTLHSAALASSPFLRAVMTETSPSIVSAVRYLSEFKMGSLELVR